MVEFCVICFIMHQHGFVNSAFLSINLMSETYLSTEIKYSDLEKNSYSVDIFTICIFVCTLYIK